MLTIWIIHRDPHHRNALARIAGAGDGTVIGGPGDSLFAGAPAPDAVVLGLAGDFEQELEFVHRFGGRFSDCTWLLLSPPSEHDQVRLLFDTVDAQPLAYPASAHTLRRALRVAIRRHRADSLTARQNRERLRERFGRWFGDLDLPEWMHALDPRLAEVPVLIRGEEGTGRGLLARYIHTFSGDGEEVFLHVGCAGITSLGELGERIGDGGRTRVTSGRVTIWLDEVDQLPAPVQRGLRDWIEFGPAPAALRGATLRWMAGAGDDADLDLEPGIDPRLADVLAVIDLRIPSLHERGEGIERFVEETALFWGQTRSEAPRQFSHDALALLRAHPWPGNLHELESVLLRTLALSGADPVLPGDLRFPEAGHWLPQGGENSADSTVASKASEAAKASPGGSRDILSFFEPEPADDETPAMDPLQMATDAALNSLVPEAASTPEPGRESNLRRAIQAVAHAVRNPLVSIRTFAELLPEQYDDPEFRDQFRELVGQDVARIDEAITRLQNTVDLPSIGSHPVDLAHLLDKLLDEHAEEIRSRQLLVLKELDHGLPHAYGDPMLLRDAFGGLLQRALASVKDRGDIYIASKHHEGSRGGEPSIRVLIRYSVAPGSPPSRDPAPGAENLDAVMAQTIIQSLGGSFTTDTTDADEFVVIIDLPAPGPE